MPSPPSRRAACGHCGDGLRDNFNFLKLNAFTFPKERLNIWKPIPVRIFYTFVINQTWISYLEKVMTSYTMDMTWISQMQII